MPHADAKASSFRSQPGYTLRNQLCQLLRKASWLIRRTTCPEYILGLRTYVRIRIGLPAPHSSRITDRRLMRSRSLYVPASRTNDDGSYCARFSNVPVGGAIPLVRAPDKALYRTLEFGSFKAYCMASMDCFPLRTITVSTARFLAPQSGLVDTSCSCSAIKAQLPGGAGTISRPLSRGEIHKVIESCLAFSAQQYRKIF